MRRRMYCHTLKVLSGSSSAQRWCQRNKKPSTLFCSTSLECSANTLSWFASSICISRSVQYFQKGCCAFFWCSAVYLMLEYANEGVKRMVCFCAMLFFRPSWMGLWRLRENARRRSVTTMPSYSSTGRLTWLNHGLVSRKVHDQAKFLLWSVCHEKKTL